ncbi:uncharacterized protein LOC123499694 [Portunus trituberculatus]|uniref:uncharacterized protein LOC123499694 n=1 Tax=Portunus trituberculatus TaxID=210409 RepID=UPI001E1CB67C|nr:uncharacterized protein LOC123499694 [Portunus trituberculatus]
MLQRTCLVLAVVVMVVVVRQAAAEPHYKVYDKDDDCSTTILYTTTKGETTKTVHQARYVITSTKTVTETTHGDHYQYGHVHTKTVTENCDDHTHTKYVLKPVTVTDSITKYEDKEKTVTHLKETTETVTKTHCGYGYRHY